MIKMNRRHKDSLFRALFSDKENFISLYNAIHETNLDPKKTEVKQLEIPQTLYSTYKNDISMLIEDKIIVLIEHQSTINQNMPIRFLEYVTRLYEQILKTENRYRESVIPLPVPEFYVFYNGEKKYTQKTLKLSDAFISHAENPPLELNVEIKNIQSTTNKDSELKLMEYCSILKEYALFIEIVKKYKNNRRGFKKAVEEAISNGILKDFLENNFKEIINMLCARYSYMTDIRVKAQEAAEIAFKEGTAQERIETAKRMLAKNYPITDISEISGLSVKEIEQLKINS